MLATVEELESPALSLSLILFFTGLWSWGGALLLMDFCLLPQEPFLALALSLTLPFLSGFPAGILVFEPYVSESYKYLQEHNISTREQLAQPPQLQPVQEQQQRPQQREVPQPQQWQQPSVPPALEYVPPTAKAVPLRPPPGLELLPPGLSGARAKAPPIAPPPQPARQPVAGPQQHGPVGKHHNPARQRPQPQQAGAVLQQPTVLQPSDMDNDYIDTYDCYNLTLETNILHVAVNEDKKERLLQQELMLYRAVLLPSYQYHDNLEQYDKQEVLTAMKKELDKIRQKDMHEECDKSTLSQEQLRKIVKTLWVVGDRPDPSTTTTTGVQPASELRARFVCSQGLLTTCRWPDGWLLRGYAFFYKPQETTVVGNPTRSSDYMPRHIHSLYKHAPTGDRRDLRPTAARMVLRFTYYCLAPEEGHVWTTCESKSLANASWASTTTRFTTMQSRQVFVYYIWLGSVRPCGQLTTSRRVGGDLWPT